MYTCVNNVYMSRCVTDVLLMCFWCVTDVFLMCYWCVTDMLLMCYSYWFCLCFYVFIFFLCGIICFSFYNEIEENQQEQSLWRKPTGIATLKKTNRNSHFEENQQEQPLWRKPTGTATLKKTNRNSDFAYFINI